MNIFVKQWSVILILIFSVGSVVSAEEISFSDEKLEVLFDSSDEKVESITEENKWRFFNQYFKVHNSSGIDFLRKMLDILSLNGFIESSPVRLFTSTVVLSIVLDIVSSVKVMKWKSKFLVLYWGLIFSKIGCGVWDKVLCSKKKEKIVKTFLTKLDEYGQYIPDELRDEFDIMKKVYNARDGDISRKEAADFFDFITNQVRHFTVESIEE